MLAAELLSDGAISDVSGKRVYESSRPKMDAAAMSFGVFPREYTKRFQQTKEYYRAIKEPEEARKHFNERVARGLYEQQKGQGTRTLDNVKADIEEYNRKYPYRPYDYDANGPHIEMAIAAIVNPTGALIRKAPATQRNQAAEIFGYGPLTEGQ
jgi:hypothetical protein